MEYLGGYKMSFIDMDRVMLEKIKRRVSNKELAKLWGVTTKSVTNKLKNRTSITSDELFIFANRVQVEVQYFFTNYVSKSENIERN